ncbi:hypothetical protein FEM03_22485 [Phragmitibacter flavus]|uniref:PDZ domain-containing protein n=1 Tax=Phragmitibacter flavus TaxID=2576071 RepID=A0A5R8K7Z8_9BACT|nr:PDZ domain-containing protein [Phragmitibacter flavus]TLD68474.1 hypothetical protein FEM03_22485 [Phragmitibacter flavus]
MNRPLLFITVTLLAVISLAAIWKFLPKTLVTSSTLLSKNTSPLSETLQKQIHKTRQQLTGGIGIGIVGHPGRFPEIVGTLSGSPAQLAGLTNGDQLIAIDQESTLGYTDKQVVAASSGWPGTLVELTIKKPDGIEQIVILERQEWQDLNRGTMAPSSTFQLVPTPLEKPLGDSTPLSSPLDTDTDIAVEPLLPTSPVLVPDPVLLPNLQAPPLSD